MESKRARQLYRFYCLEDVEDSQTASAEITCCVFDSTGYRLACAFGDHRVLVLSANSKDDLVKDWKKTVYTVSTKAAIIYVDWNTDGSLIAAGDLNNLLYIFSTNDGLLSSFTQLPSNLTNIQWNRRGTPHLLLTSGNDGEVILWNTSEERPLIQESFSSHTSSVRGLQWLTKETFASCSLDGSIYVYRVGQKEPLQSLFQEHPVLSIHFNIKYDCIAFFSYELNVKIWFLGDDSVRECFGHRGGIYSLSWNESDDFSQLASGADDKTVRIWSVHNPLCEKVLDDMSSLVSAVCFSPDGRYLAAADTNGMFVVWSTKSWLPLLKNQCRSTILDSKSLRWNPASSKLVVASQCDQLVVVELGSEDTLS